MGKPKIKKFQQDLLAFKHIGIDSMCFIYQFADHSVYAQLTNELFALLEKKKIRAATSTISLIEVFVKPEEKHNQYVIAEYESVFQHLPNLEIVPVDWYLARLASKLRATYKDLKTPDAIQIGATLLMNYPVFLTNDNKLKQVKEVRIVSLGEYA